MAFSTQKFFFNVSDMNEPTAEQLCKEACVTMQTYNAATDDRSWAMDDVLQSKFFEGLLVCDMVEVCDVESSEDESFLRDDKNRYGDLEQPSTSGRRKDKKQRAKGKRGRGSDDNGSLDDSDTGKESHSKKIKPIRDDGKDKTYQEIQRKDKSKSWDDDEFGERDSFESSSDIDELKNKGKSKPSKDRRDSNNKIYENKEYNDSYSKDDDNSRTSKQQEDPDIRFKNDKGGKGKETKSTGSVMEEQRRSKKRRSRNSDRYSEQERRRSKSKPKGKETGQVKPGKKEDRTGNKETHRDRDNRHGDQKKEPGSRDHRKTDGKNSRLDDTKDKDKDRDGRERQRSRQSKDKVDKERDPRSGNNKRTKDKEKGKYDSEDDDDGIVKKEPGQGRDNLDGDQKKVPRSRTDGKDSRMDDTKDKYKDRDGRERQGSRQSKDKVKYGSEDDDEIVKKEPGQDRDNLDGYQKKDSRSRDVKRTDGKDSKLNDTKDKYKDRDGRERQRSRQSKDKVDKERDPRTGNDKRTKDKETGKSYSEDDDDRIVKKEPGQGRDNLDGDQKKDSRSRDVKRTDGKDSRLDDTKDKYKDRDGRERQRSRRSKDKVDKERDPRTGNDKRTQDKEKGKYDSEDDDDGIVKKEPGQGRDNLDGDQKKDPRSRDVKRTDGKDSKLNDTKDKYKERDGRERQRSRQSKDKVDKERDPRSGNDKRTQDKEKGKYDSEDDDDEIVKKEPGQGRDNLDGDQKKDPRSRDVKRTYGKDSRLDDTKDKDRDGRKSQKRSRDYKNDDQERELRSRDQIKVKDEKTSKGYKEDRMGKEEHDGERDYKKGEQEKEPRSAGDSRADRKDTKLNNAKDMDKDGKKIQSHSKDPKNNDQRIELESEDYTAEVNSSKYDIEGKRGHRTTPMKIQDVHDRSRSTNSLSAEKRANQRIKEETYKYDLHSPTSSEIIGKKEVYGMSSKRKLKTISVHDDVTDHTETLKPTVSEAQDKSGVERRNLEQGRKVKEEQKPTYDRAEEHSKMIYHKENESSRSQIKKEQAPEKNRHYFDSENREKPDDQEKFESKYIYAGVNEKHCRQKSKHGSESSISNVKSLHENVSHFSSRDCTRSAGSSSHKSPNVDIAQRVMRIKRECVEGVLDDDDNDRGKRTRIPGDDRGHSKYEDGVCLEGKKKKQTLDQERVLKSERYDSKTKMHSQDRPVLESDHKTLQKTSFIAQIFGLNERPSIGQSTSRGQIVQRRSFLEKLFGRNQNKSGKCVKQAKDMNEDEGNKRGNLKAFKCGDTSVAKTNDLFNVSFIDDNLGENTLHNNCNKIESLKACYSWNNDTEIELNQLCSVSKNFLQAYQCMSAENEELKKLCKKLGENFSGKYIDAEKLTKVTMECNELRKKCQNYREIEKKYEALQEKDSCASETIRKLTCELNNRNSLIGNLEVKCREIQMFYDNKCGSISNEKEMLEYQIYSLKEELFESKCALNNVDSLRRENAFLSNEIQKLEAALHDSDSQYKCLMKVIEELGGDKNNFPKLPTPSDNNYSNGAGSLEDVAYFTKAVLLGIKNRLKDGGDFDTNADTIDNIKRDCKKSLEDVQEDCRKVCCEAMDKVQKLMKENEYLKKMNFQMLNENNCLVAKLKSNDSRIKAMCNQLSRLDKELCVNAKQTADINSSLTESATLIREIGNYQMKNHVLEEATKTEQCKLIKELEEKLELNNKILLDCQAKNEMYKKITDEAGLKLDHSNIGKENQCSPYGFIGVNISKKEHRTAEGYQMDVTGVIEMEIVDCEKNVEENEHPRGLNEMPVYETDEYNTDLDDKEPTISSNYIGKTETKVTDLGIVSQGSFVPKSKIKSDDQIVPRRSVENLYKSETDDNEPPLVKDQPEAKIGTFVPRELSLTRESDSVDKKIHSKRRSSPRKLNVKDKMTSGVTEPDQGDERNPTRVDRPNQSDQVQKSEKSPEIKHRGSVSKSDLEKNIISRLEDEVKDSKRENETAVYKDEGTNRKNAKQTDQVTDNKSDKESPKVNDEVTNRKKTRSPSRQQDEVTDNKNAKTPSKQQDEGTDRKNTRTPSRQTDQVTDNKNDKESSKVKYEVTNRKNTRSPSRQTDQVTDNKNNKDSPKVKDEGTNRKNTRRPSRQEDNVFDRKNARRPSRQQDEVTGGKNSPRGKADNKKDKGSNVRELPETSGEKNKPKSGKSPRKSIENSERDVDIAKTDRKKGPGRRPSFRHSARVDYSIQDSPDRAQLFKDTRGSQRTRCVDLDKKCVSRDCSYRKTKGFPICDLGYDKLLKPLPACLGGGSGKKNPCAAMRLTYLSKLNLNNCGNFRSSSDTDCSEKTFRRCKTKERKKGGQETFESDDEDNSAYENFVKVHALFLNEKIKHGENVQQVLKVILNALLEECGFCFCKNLIPKGKFYVICHKILHRGIQNIEFKELIYLHGKIVKMAESLNPGELISYIQHNFSIKNNSLKHDVLNLDDNKFHNLHEDV